MSGGGTNDLPSPGGLPTGGEFLLSLLQKRPHNHASQSQPPPPLQTQLQNLSIDPAVAALGPSVSYPAPSNSGRDVVPPWPHNLSPPLQPNPFPHNYVNFPPPGNLNFPGKFPSLDDFGRFGFDWRGRVAPPHTLAHHSKSKQHYDHQQHEHHNSNMRFVSSTPSEVHTISMLPNGVDGNIDSLRLGSLDDRDAGLVGRNFVNRIENSRQFSSLRGGSGSGSSVNVNSHSHGHGMRRENFDHREQDWKVIGKGRQGSGGNHQGTLPAGFGGRLSGGGDKDFGGRRWGFEHDEDGERSSYRELNNRNVGSSNGEVKLRRFPGDDGRGRNEQSQSSRGRGLLGQLERPGPPTGSNLPLVSPSDAEDPLFELARESGAGEFDDYAEKLADSLLHEGELDGKNDKTHHRRDKDFRSDTRGKHLLTQRMRNLKRHMECRIDILQLDAPFLEIFKSLIPPEEEKAKQKQLLTLLEKLVNKEWPEAQLFLYGSCANSFGVCKSDIDVCLAIQDAEIDKSEVLLKLAEILESDNLQNVQALTRARVPIVKLMDPATGISCDICINNVLAVVNTKLLRDYAQIDSRLRQLAFIVKHWAKSRGVNETYQGTLSSYAYVLMCIHFLQQHRPAILPCLQEMEKTYSVIVDDVQCSYFDQVEKLQGFGSHNRETIGQLVWAFFHYWAYRHDYANSVISVRTGTLLSKQSKDWTRRIGNDRHLICIEDPFDTSHDLGRVVDKFSIKVLREEFERAAEIMQYDPNPCVTLFEPYVSPSNNT